MIEIKIVNKIGEMLTKIKRENGISKVWIAEQMGITRQGLNILCNTTNPTIESLIKVSVIIKCDIEELYSYEVVNK